MPVSKYVVYGLLMLAMSGCAQQGKQTFSDSTNEKILESSGSYSQLIELYKKQLVQKESLKTRIKLIKTYEKVGDYSSAIFYLQPLLKTQPKEFAIQRLAGRAYLNTQEYKQAEYYLSLAHRNHPTDAKVMNLLGVMAGYQGDLVQAQLWFSKARSSMGNDHTIKNNLALIALLQKDYGTARRLLESLINDETNKNKQTVKANLALVYAKQGDQAAFLTLTKQLDENKQSLLYKQLRALKLVNLQQLSVSQNDQALQHK